MRLIQLHPLGLMILALVLMPLAAMATQWPEHVAHESEHGHYALVDTPAVAELLKSNNVLVLDVRPDYEFRDAHIDGAVNVEFDLNDQHEAAPAKLERIRRMAGNDLDRPILIYCRSLQCLRSAIAARAVSEMGYTNVMRYPRGWQGWVEMHPELKPDEQKRICIGDPFPGCPLWPLTEEAKAYLGLKEEERSILEGIDSDFLLMQFFNSECPACLQGLQTVKQYWNRVQGDDVMRKRLRFVGMASHDCPHDAQVFSERQGVPFPVFTDPDGTVLGQTGYTSLPVTFLLRKGQNGRWQVVDIKDGLGGANRFYRDMRSSVKAGY